MRTGVVDAPVPLEISKASRDGDGIARTVLTSGSASAPEGVGRGVAESGDFWLRWAWFSLNKFVRVDPLLPTLSSKPGTVSAYCSCSSRTVSRPKLASSF